MTERFWSKVDIRAPDECWPWKACTDGYGYGLFRLSGARVERSHRIAFRLTNGEIPLRKIVRHTCDNPPCCNPAHLRVGTMQDNMEDREERGRTARGGRNGRAKLTDKQAIEILHSAQSERRLAERYGVSSPLIYNIKARRIWRHIS